MGEKIKIVIADDHTMFREGVVAMLKEINNISIAGSVSSGDEVLALLENQETDIVITDLTMDNMDGLELTKQLNMQYPNIQVLVLTMHNDSVNIKDLLEAGASGYLLKNAKKQEFLEAIHQVYLGENYFSEGVKNILINSMTKKKKSSENNPIKLTKRETEILSLIAQEFTNLAISEKLFISLYTVETHRRNIMKKLNVHNGVGLLRQAIQLGLVTE